MFLYPCLPTVLYELGNLPYLAPTTLVLELTKAFPYICFSKHFLASVICHPVPSGSPHTPVHAPSAFIWSLHSGLESRSTASSLPPCLRVEGQRMKENENTKVSLSSEMNRAEG